MLFLSLLIIDILEIATKIYQNISFRAPGTPKWMENLNIWEL
jgi:hypothetical protein